MSLTDDPGRMALLQPQAQMCHLPEDHPGFHDSAYRARRAEISRIGAAYRSGDPIPDVAYTPDEDDVWRVVSSELAAKHQQLACREVIDAAARVVLPVDRVPQLREVNERVHALTGFAINPVPGLVPTRQFYGALADRTFLSTQYIRHHSVPRYTPEPDIVHEIIGHANSLGSARFADIYEAAGHASRRAESDEGLEFFSRVWWFTMEFGVVHEDGALKAYGAGLLSSFGEMDAFRSAEIHDWEIAAMGTRDYDITTYQPTIFAAASMDQVFDDLGAFFESFDDDVAARMTKEARR